jgi:hypothetical protein
MVEEWKDIEGFEQFYCVSNIGRVKSLNRVTQDGRHLKGALMTCSKGKTGYRFVKLRKSGKVQVYVHRLVAQAFIGVIPEGYNVNHKDGNKANNCVTNLEIVTCSENTIHAYRTGLFKNWLKPVIGYKKKTGEMVGVFNSITEAAKITGVDKSDIVRVCKNKRYSAGGVIWSYSHGAQ